MVQVPTKPLTLEEFLALPETKPASEFIDGNIIQKPMPQGKHSVLQRELTFTLTAAFRANPVGQAFPELRCTFGGRSIVPDIAVFRADRIPRDSSGEVANTFNLPPDWTIEILSPGQSQSRVIRNILHCLSHGAELGWLLDPEEVCIFVYGADRSVQLFDEPDSVLPVPAFAEAVQLTVGEIFGWLQV
ncbi:Uma2 family endonuclease [Thermoleptolyngbya sp. C42_A2020_037]|uniref:Uma2 family endonuclease n=1 Tax=Thermoleptolyngbya sp. C42_A2020_037 TaxID=2747799 RepID=UPI0019E71E68|nr:Uma2 family endonuclease [Thermoleptolyngbya sp. C42_A2020_037]MBF2085576.1 Uma2 family endonuclease [Thermoleptolyngbya sp. C42_A2020_037]